jgi:hypothetical protein
VKATSTSPLHVGPHCSQTVEETLGYVAELRLPPLLTPEERQERVDAVIEVRKRHFELMLIASQVGNAVQGGHGHPA